MKSSRTEALNDGVVLQAGDQTVFVGGDLDHVVGGGACPDGAEHLLATENDLDGLVNDAGGHRAEDNVRPGGALGSEAAADDRAGDVDVILSEVQDAGQATSWTQ